MTGHGRQVPQAGSVKQREHNQGRHDGTRRRPRQYPEGHLGRVGPRSGSRAEPAADGGPEQRPDDGQQGYAERRGVPPPPRQTKGMVLVRGQPEQDEQGRHRHADEGGESPGVRDGMR